MPKILVNVVVTCTARKTREPLRVARMRNVKSNDLLERLREWLTGLASVKQKVPAANMYCGGAWLPVSRLLALEGVQIWIISAGHGLVSPTENICAYSATFSNGHADSVVPRRGDFNSAEWWDALTKQGESPTSIRSIADVAGSFPRVPLVTSLSSEYLLAVKNDLVRAREALADPERLIVISSGGSKRGELKDNMLPCDARMEHVVGRGRTALNSRVLESLLLKHGFDLRASNLRKSYSRLVASLPKSTYPNRLKADDQAVLEFIQKEISKQPQVSHTGLLRVFRSKGLACEQSRFRLLFRRAIHPRGSLANA